MRYNMVYSLIERRNKCIHSNYDKPDCGYLLESSSMNAREYFFRGCASTNNANKYYDRCISELCDDKDSRLTNIFVESILPYVDDLGNISYSIERYRRDLPYKTVNVLETAVEQIKIADRVLDNHNKINEKYDIANTVYLKRNQGTNRICRAVCEAVDKFNLKEHAKLNVAIEESSYLLHKNKIKYKNHDLIKSVVEYFLMRNGGEDQGTIDKMKKVLSENSFINDNDLYKVGYLYEGVYHENLSMVMQLLDGFTKADNTKTISGDFCGICQAMPDTDKVPQSDFCNGMSILLKYVRENLLYDAYDILEIVDALKHIPEAIEIKMSNDPMSYTREELECIINSYKAEMANLENMISESQDQVMATKLIALKNCYEDSVNRIMIFQNDLYTKYNIECMTHASKVVTETLYLNEFKIFKFNNIMKLAAQAERAVHRRTKSASKKLQNALNIADKIAKASNKEAETAKAEKIVKKMKRKSKKKGLFELSLAECVTAEGTVDILIEDFDLVDESCLSEIHEFMSDVCKDINDNVLTRETACCYYRVTGDSVEIHMEDAMNVITNSAEEYDLQSEAFNYEDKCNIVELAETADLLDEMDFDRAINLHNEIKEAAKWIDKERFDLIIEASQYTDLISDDDIREFVEIYSRTNDLDLNESYIQTEDMDAPLEVQVEAYDIICSILETDEEKLEAKKKKFKKQKEEDGKTIGDRIREKLPGKKKDKDEEDSKDDKDSEDKKEDDPTTKDDESKSDDSDNKTDDKDSDIKTKKFGKNKDDAEDGGDDKKAGNGVNLNSLKLAVKGMKGKCKDLGNKAQNASKNMDMASKRLMDGIKDSLTNDRREGIITGSVVPSFKRCVKWGIALAGLGLVTHNPIIPAIVAIGALAVSKNLNKKERLLLMDEIDTELEVVNKEIDIAESRHQMKKYRELLKYKKELQRQYQRIKYNTRVGKDLMPGVTTGLPEDRQ